MSTPPEMTEVGVRTRAPEGQPTRKEQLVANAASLFAERGFHATSIGQIADALGLTKAALYHYIDSKEDLLVQIHRQAMAAVDSRVRAIMQLDLGAEEKLRRAIAAHIAVIVDELPIMRVLLQETYAVPEAYRAQLAKNQQAYVSHFRDLIELGQVEGSFRHVDGGAATFLVLGMLNWVSQWYRPDGRLTAEELGTIAADIATSGLRERDGSTTA